MAYLDITLFGQGPLAVSVLKRLIDENQTVKLVNDSEGPEGLLSKAAKLFDIATVSIHPRKSETALKNEINKYSGNCGYLLSINYRFIIQKTIFKMFDWPLNIHGSLLPKYRGRTPHVWAIIYGESVTGVTVHLIDEGVDTGPIVLQKSIQISLSDTGADLLEKFEKQYPELIVEAIQRLENGFKPTKQEETEAFYLGRRIPEMGLIDFRLSLSQIKDFIRAQAPPYPGAYCYLPNGNKIIVIDIELINKNFEVTVPKYVPYSQGDDILVKTDEGMIRCIEGDSNKGRNM